MNALIISVVVLAAVYGFLMVLYALGWNGSSLAGETPVCSGRTRVSVIIPARNEAAHIRSCLEAVLAQHYPAKLLEVIVVDDDSSDETGLVARSVSGDRVRVLFLPDFLIPGTVLVSPKKKAIETAVARAGGELILTTDADCIMGPQWVSSMVACYEQTGARCIAAPVAYHREHSLFQVFQSLDFLGMQGVTGASGYFRSGTLCNGANLGYAREAFLEVGGFSGVDGIASGDDMLLMHKIYLRYPRGTTFLKSRSAIVFTIPQPDIRSFLHQRVRWASKASKFRDRRVTGVLLVVYLWNLMFPILLAGAWLEPVLGWFFLGCLLYKTLVELLFLVPVTRFFHKERLLLYFFPCQILHIPYILTTGFLGLFKRYEWKGRILR